MPLPTIKYPYLPEGRSLLYVPAENAFMQEAKAFMQRSGCRKHANAAVAVLNNQVVAKGSNAAMAVTICPRVYKGYGTGEGYQYCKEYCGQQGHSEVMMVRDAQTKGIDLAGADIYLYGHWWACKNCWDTMLAERVGNVYVTDKAHELFNDQARDPGEFDQADLKVYVSGSLTNLTDASVKTLYEQIGQLAQTHGFEAHVPHLHTDPLKNAAATPEEVYAFDQNHLKESDVVIAYIGQPSLGTGMELEMALKHSALVVLLSEKGANLSRLALGSPTIIEHIQFDSHADALGQLGDVFEKLLKAAKRKNMSSL